MLYRIILPFGFGGRDHDTLILVDDNANKVGAPTTDGDDSSVNVTVVEITLVHSVVHACSSYLYPVNGSRPLESVYVRLNPVYTFFLSFVC